MKILNNFKQKWSQDTPNLWAKVRDFSGIITLIFGSGISTITAIGLLPYLPEQMMQLSAIGLFVSGCLTAYAGTRTSSKNN